MTFGIRLMQECIDFPVNMKNFPTLFHTHRQPIASLHACLQAARMAALPGLLTLTASIAYNKLLWH
jgi:hypothetical protein